MTTPDASRPKRLLVRLSATATGAVLGVLLTSGPAGAATSGGGGSGYGYGYGYGYGGAGRSLLRTALNTQTVVAALPAGALLGAALLWERRNRRVRDALQQG